VLAVALGAVLAGARSLAAIADWPADLPVWSWRRWRIGRRAPSLSTIRRVLIAVDADVLDAVLHAWLGVPPHEPASPSGSSAVAVDGKTDRVRGARRRVAGAAVLDGRARQWAASRTGRDHRR
jgi:hypothetical protein